MVDKGGAWIVDGDPGEEAAHVGRHAFMDTSIDDAAFVLQG
jgi:hypothetical protein